MSVCVCRPRPKLVKNLLSKSCFRRPPLLFRTTPLPRCYCLLYSTRYRGIPVRAVPIGIKVCRYNWHSAGPPGLAIFNAKNKYIFQTNCTEAILSNRTRKLLCFKISWLRFKEWIYCVVYNFRHTFVCYMPVTTAVISPLQLSLEQKLPIALCPAHPSSLFYASLHPSLFSSHASLSPIFLFHSHPPPHNAITSDIVRTPYSCLNIQHNYPRF